MKYKRDVILLGIMVITAILAAGITIFFNNSQKKEGVKQEMLGKGNKDLQITASFYPMYIITKNVTDNIEEVSLGCMAQNQTGCLHDYQITTKDMKMLESSDIFIVNGGGMESFLTDIISNYPSLTIVNAGQGLESLVKQDHSDNEEEEEKIETEVDIKIDKETEVHKEHEDESNAHFWLNPAYYILQIQAVADNLAELDKVHAKQYKENAEVYIEKVRELAGRMQTELEVPAVGVAVFHDAFIYLAEYLGLNVVHAMELDGETSLNAGEIAEMMEKIREGKIEILFTEAQYSTRIADMIGKETGVHSCIIDSLVTGNGEKDSYLQGMESNLEVLKQVFYTNSQKN